MSIPTLLSNPAVLCFSIVVIGSMIGKIRVCHISLDVSAVLIAAVVFGVLASVSIPELADSLLTEKMTGFSQTGTALFLSCIALTAGHSMSGGLIRTGGKAFLLGSLMVLTGIAFTEALSVFDSGTDKALLYGILCGAMTSTPGLSTVCEANPGSGDLALLGYGYSYLFGVIGVVVFVQRITSGMDDKLPNNCNHMFKQQTGKMSDSLLLIGLTAVAGSLVGSLRLLSTGFSLGTSGGILCTGLAIGALAEKRGRSLDFLCMAAYRKLGLMLFFAGSGIPAGIRLSSAFHLKWFVYGIFLTILPILFGYLFCRYFLKTSSDCTAALIAGGMTSTPAIGALLTNRNLSPDLSAYSFAYVGALLTMVIGVSLLI